MSNKMLRECFDRNKCDKGERHEYEHVYAPLLEELIIEKKKKNQPLWILEVGIYKGASIQAWIDYFDSTLFSDYYITGIDTFQRINPDKIKVLDHSHVQGIKADSTKDISELDLSPCYDLIIDDGLHTPEAQRKTFEIFFPLLKNGCSYIIEDVWPIHLMDDKEMKSHWWMRKYYDEFTREKHEALMETIAKGGHVIEHDNREATAHADSFILEIIKGE